MRVMVNFQKQQDLTLLLNATDELKLTTVPEWKINLTEPTLRDKIVMIRDTVHGLPRMLVEARGAKEAEEISVHARNEVMVCHLTMSILLQRFNFISVSESLFSNDEDLHL